jgi:hypothetical protein
MYSSSIKKTVNPCPTSDSTWPRTASLAVCGQCLSLLYVSSCRAHYPNDTSTTTCNYIMPSGSTFQIFPDSYWAGDFLYLGFGIDFNNGGRHFVLNVTERPYLAQFDMFGARYGIKAATLWPKDHWPNASTIASKCAFGCASKPMKHIPVRDGKSRKQLELLMILMVSVIQICLISTIQAASKFLHYRASQTQHFSKPMPQPSLASKASFRTFSMVTLHYLPKTLFTISPKQLKQPGKDP